jgi:hypothetical protein
MGTVWGQWEGKGEKENLYENSIMKLIKNCFKRENREGH